MYIKQPSSNFTIIIHSNLNIRRFLNADKFHQLSNTFGIRKSNTVITKKKHLKQ